MESKIILLSILILFHICYTLRITIIIISNPQLSKKRKIINSIMVWIIPIIWYDIVKGSMTKDNGVMTKQKRDKIVKERRVSGFFDGGGSVM